jgi:hypothetical protein
MDQAGSAEATTMSALKAARRRILVVLEIDHQRDPASEVEAARRVGRGVTESKGLRPRIQRALVA